MSFLGSDLITPSIEKAKSLLWPFNLAVWLKLAIFTIFVGGSGSGFNFNYDSRLGDRNVYDFFAQYWEMILIIVGILLIVRIIYSFLSAVFQFCFLDSLSTKKVLVLGYFKKNLKKGKSLFILEFIVGTALLLLFIALAYPPIKAVMNGTSLNIIYLILAVILFILLSVVTSTLIRILTIYHMYVTNKGSWESLKSVMKLFRTKFKEIGIFLLLNLALGIAVGMITMIAVLLFIVVLAIIAALIFGLGYLMYNIATVLLIPLIVVGVLIGLIWGIALTIGSLMLVVPFTTFFAYYRLDFMKQLLGKKNEKTLQ